jgi:hypothetical protein
MDIDMETLFKIIAPSVTIVLAPFTISYYIDNRQKNKNSELREQYKFAKDFLHGISQEKNHHPLIKEKGYYAIAGTKKIESKVVEYILSLENPNKCLENYVSGKKYLIFIEKESNFKIYFSNEYEKKFKRDFLKIFYLISSLVSYLFATIPILFYDKINNNENLFIYLFFITPVFLLFGWVNLTPLNAIRRAEELISSQNKHTKLIQTSIKS